MAKCLPVIFIQKFSKGRQPVFVQIHVGVMHLLVKQHIFHMKVFYLFSFIVKCSNFGGNLVSS